MSSTALYWNWDRGVLSILPTEIVFVFFPGEGGVASRVWSFRGRRGPIVKGTREPCYYPRVVFNVEPRAGKPSIESQSHDALGQLSTLFSSYTKLGAGMSMRRSQLDTPYTALSFLASVAHGCISHFQPYDGSAELTTATCHNASSIRHNHPLWDTPVSHDYSTGAIDRGLIESLKITFLY